MSSVQKKFLLLAFPSIFLIALDLRSEIETSITSWVGVAGYSRTHKWLFIPVYQNFINLGSPLPLMSHITVSPIAILGALLPVQIVQQLITIIALTVTAALLATSPLSARLRPASTTPLSALLFLPSAHYFIVNDWSENALVSYGTIILLLLLVELNLTSPSNQLRPHLLLWVGALHLSVGHLGHLGVPIYSLAFVGALSFRNQIFRHNLRQNFFLVNICSCVLLCGLIWLPSVEYLLRNQVISNPRPVSLSAQLRDFASAGLKPVVDAIFERDLPHALTQVVAHRGFLAVLPLLLINICVSLRPHQTSRGKRKPYELQVALLVSACFLLALTFMAGSRHYPLRPSSDYQFRDALLPILVFAIYTKPVLTCRPTENKEAFQGPPKGIAPGRRRRGIRLLILVVWLPGVALALSLARPRLDDVSGGEAIGCAEAGEFATIWVDYPLWRGKHPATPYSPNDCSLLQMIEDNQFSIGGWLKMHQTPSDGQPSFELENRTETLELVQFSAVYNPEFVPLSSSDFVFTASKPVPSLDAIASRQQGPAYERCVDQLCVLRLVQRIDAGESILWNANHNLFWDDRLDIAEMNGGLVTTSSNLAASSKLVYRPPSQQKISVCASWSLWVGIPLVSAIWLFAVRRSRRNREICSVDFGRSSSTHGTG